MDSVLAAAPQSVAQDVVSFADFAALGYRRLVPVIPPDAEISPTSSLARRKDARGKAVGVRRTDGLWSGFDWVKHEADEADYSRWQVMGAGVGIKTGAVGDGTSLVLIDADTLTDDHARTIRDHVRDMIEDDYGRPPIRVGRYPKAGYVLRVSGDYRYTRVAFGERNEKGELKDRVEILSDGRQFVARGIHPVTREPYAWPRPLVPLDDLPVVPPAVLDAFMARLARALPAALEPVREGAPDTNVSQESLRAPVEFVRAAVDAIPNTSEHFATRESYRDMGYAIKAAVADEAEAFNIFSDWCARWSDGNNDPDIVAADWRRMKPPFRRGAHWLFDLAERYGPPPGSPGSFSAASAFFSPVSDDDNPFAALQAADAAASAPEPIRWINPRAWAGVEPPEREWEVFGWIPRYEVTLLYGDGGVGKTLAIHHYATAAAAGVDWLGQPTRQARVMCFFCEDSEDELLRRQIDINRALGVTFDDTGDRLRIASRKYLDNLFALWDRNSGAMKRQAVWTQLRDDARAFGAEVLVVDTLADTFGGSEIDRAQVNAFVKSCLGALAKEINGSVIALGHPSMAGKSSGSGTSGSTAWSNAARSRIFLRYPKGVEVGDVREMEGMKLNYGPKGNLLKLRWRQGAFHVIAGAVNRPPAPAAGVSENAAADAKEETRANLPGALGGGGGETRNAGDDFTSDNRPEGCANFFEKRGASYPSITDAADAAVLSAVASMAGVRMTLDVRPNSIYWAPRVIKSRDDVGLGELTAWSLGEVETALRRLVASGHVKPVELGRSANRSGSTYGYALDDGPPQGVFG